MIKTAIIGAGSADGGELIRLLAMHPDVEMTTVIAEGLEGTKISDHHHGLIGETSLYFGGEIDYENTDVLFVCGAEIESSELLRIHTIYPGLKIIMFHTPEGIEMEHSGIVYGLPELNRKMLVRGSTAAVIPEPFATMALIALYPFAQNLLLNGNISINVSAPQAIIDTTDINQVDNEIINVLKEVQKSFQGSVSITLTSGETRRSSLMDIEFDCPLNLNQIISLYDIYDDHNFTFITTGAVGVSEVAGTNKCIISVGQASEGKARLQVAADCRLRGSSGEAVHVMNLMFGLHEKTGLSLKASDFEPIG